MIGISFFIRFSKNSAYRKKTACDYLDSSIMCGQYKKEPW